MPKTAKNCPKNWPKFAKNCQKWPKTAKIVTKRPITRPIECMAPSLLQFWNPHTWGTQEMPKTAKNCPINWPKFAKNGQKWPKTAEIVTKKPITRLIDTVLESSHMGSQAMPKNCKKSDSGLGWTVDWGGPWTGVDRGLGWTVDWGGPWTGVDRGLWWTMDWGRPWTGVDRGLGWTVDSGGP